MGADEYAEVMLTSRGTQPKRLWTGKQIFNVLLRPNRASNVLVNLEAKCRTYSGNKDMCPYDGCACRMAQRAYAVLCGADKGVVASRLHGCPQTW